MTLSLLALSCLIDSSLYAQRADSLHRELTVVSEHEAIIESQKPLEPRYRFDNPKVTKLQPRVPRPTGDFTPQITIPKHPLLSQRATFLNYPKKIGFVAIQGGLGPNIQADAGLHIPINDYNTLVLDATHRSTWNWSSYSEGTKSWVNRHLTEALLGYRYRTLSDQLQVGIGVAHDRFNYFGLFRQGLDPQKEVGQRHHTPLDADEWYTQLSLDYQKEEDQWTLDLRAKGDYTHLQAFLNKEALASVKPSNRFNLLLDGVVDFRLSSLWYAGVKSQTSLAHNTSKAYGIAEAYHDSGVFLSQNFFFYSQLFSPFIGIDGHIGAYPWHLQIGADLGLSGYLYDDGAASIRETPSKSFRLHPYLDSYVTFNKYISLFAKAGSGVQLPDRFGDNLYNRFIAPGFAFKPEWKKIDAQIGIQVNAGSGFAFELSGGYTQYEGKNFATPRLLAFPKSTDARPPYVAFLPYQADSHLIYGKLGLSYLLHDKFKATASLVYRHYALLQGEGYPQGIVPLETSLSLTYKPISSLSLFADFFFGYGVQNVSPTDILHKEQDLAFGRILLGANYRINSFLALHGSFGNSCFIVRTFPYAYHDRYFPAAFLLGASVLF